MFTTLQPLAPEQDQHTHFTPAQGWHFAATLTRCPIGAHEAEALTREYVIVFSAEAESMPIVLLSLGDTSAYISPEGDWQAEQIPQRCRLYPFTLAPTPTAGQMIVARDADAPHFAFRHRPGHHPVRCPGPTRRTGRPGLRRPDDPAP